MGILNQSRQRSWVVTGLLLTCILVTSCGPASTPQSVTAPTAPAEPAAPAAAKGPAKGESAIVDKIRENGKLRAGIAVAPPWLLQNPATNEYFGPAIDVGKKLAEDLGVPIEFVDSGWDVMVAGIQADKFDMAIAPLFASPKRKEVIDFVTYTSAGTCYFVKKGYDKVKTLDDLNNPDITTVTYTGTGNEEGFKTKYPKAGIRSIIAPPGSQPPYEEILTGRGDVGIIDSPMAIVIEEKYPDLSVIGGANECIANPDFPYPIGLGFNKKDPVFTAYLQSIVDGMQTQIDESILKFSASEYSAP